MILAYLLVVCQYFPQFWSRFDRHCCDSGILLLSPYLSASFDPDLTETAVILAYHLILSPYLSASLDPDLTETAVILAYLTATIRIPLSQSWSRFDRSCCDSSKPAGSMPILPSQLWSRFDGRCCDSSSIPAGSICQYFPAGFDPDLTEGLVIVADLLVVCYYFPASLDPDLTETSVILAYLLIPIPLSQFWSRFDRDCCDSSTPSDTIPIPLIQSWSRFDRSCCDSSIPAGSMLLLPSQLWSWFDGRCCDSRSIPAGSICQYFPASLDPDLTEGLVIVA